VDSDAILVGCTSRKLSRAASARELYDSPLARWRREYADAQDKPWFIASAKYGLLHPDQVVEPYDVRIEDFDLAKRRVWAGRVIAQLEAELGSLIGRRIELHAGGSYRAHLRSALLSRGADVLMMVHEGDARGMVSTKRWYDDPGRKWALAQSARELRRPMTPAEWQAARRAAREIPRG